MKRKEMINFLLVGALSANHIMLYANTITLDKDLNPVIEVNVGDIPKLENLDYVTINYNEGTLSDHFENFGLHIPQKLKIKGTKPLTQEDFELFKRNIVYLDLSEAVIENNTLPEKAFSKNNDLIHISLPNTLKTISNYAFSGTSLQSINLPNNLEIIGEHAFYGSDIQSIDLPETVKDIGAFAFGYCLNLEKVVLPKNLKKIQTGAFSGCLLLKEIVLPENLEELGGLSFDNCVSLDSLILPKNLKKVDQIIEINKYNPDDKNEFKIGLFKNSIAEEKMIYYEIPYEYTLDLVSLDPIFLKIPQGAIIPENFTLTSNVYDKEGDFYPAIISLKPEDVDTSKVGSITLEKPITIENYVVNHKVQIQIEIFSEMEQEGDIKSIAPFNEILEIGEPYTLPLSVEVTLDNNQHITLPVKWDNQQIDTTKEGQYTLKGEVLLHEDLTNKNQIETTLNITVQDSSNVHKSAAEDFKIDANGKLVAYSGNAKYVEIPEGVITIGEKVFRNQHQLEKVVFPSTLKNIEEAAFRNATQLKEVVFNEGLESIGHSAFEKCMSLQKIELPTSLKTIGISAFALCSSLTSVNLGGNLAVISSSAFFNCENLKEVLGTDQLKTIQFDSFKFSKNLKTIDLSNVSYIGKTAFFGSGLESLKFNQLDYLGESAFALSRSMQKIDFGESPLKIIPKYAFVDNFILNKLVLPKSLKEIQDYAFYVKHDYRVILEDSLNINLPATLEKVGAYAFGDNDYIETLTVNSKCELSNRSFPRVENLVLNQVFTSKEDPRDKVLIVATNVFVNVNNEFSPDFIRSDNVVFADGLTRINLMPFVNADDITIPSSVNYISLSDPAKMKADFKIKDNKYAFDFLVKAKVMDFEGNNVTYFFYK